MNRSNIIHKFIALSIAILFAIAQARFLKTERVQTGEHQQVRTIESDFARARGDYGK